jgi:TolA-binding protein
MGGEVSVKILRPITALAGSAAIMVLLPASSAIAQRQAPSPEQRIQRLERQVDQMQRRVFPKGRPADTAGYSDDPAATQSSVITLNQRLDALERQMTDLLRQSEENNNHLRTLETGIGQLRADQEQRLQALEQRVTAAESAAAAPAPAQTDQPPAATPPKTKPSATTPKTKPSAQPPKTSAEAAKSDAPESADASATDPGEEAYSQGFHEWEAGNYDAAIGTLRDFVKTYPKHRRTSYANNLIGRALLDKGDTRAAAQALLANYRSNPGGERAPDSLFYLGQALMKLGQPAQACKAYAELDAVYGAKVRPDLKKLETDAKSAAQCS